MQYLGKQGNNSIKNFSFINSVWLIGYILIIKNLLLKKIFEY